MPLSPPDPVVYSAGVEDPPWDFDDGLPGDTRGADKHYDTHLTNDQIIKQQGFSFHYPRFDDDSVLFLWRVGAMVEEAYQAVRARGFRPSAEMVWIKKTKNGKRWFGMGRTVRWEHEVCIIGVRGSSALVVADNGVRSTFEAPVPVYEAGDPKIGQPLLDKQGKPRVNKRGEPMVVEEGDYIHSAKPDKFYEIVMQMCAGPYVELFARPRSAGWHRPGWRCYGNELPGGVA